MSCPGYAERILEAVLSKNKSPAMLAFGMQIFEKYGPQLAQTVPNSLAEAMKIDELSKEELVLLNDLLLKAVGDKPDYPTKGPFGPEYDEPKHEGLYRLTRRKDGHIQICRVEEGSNGAEK